jgi:RNA polymerase sigma-70 factor (ECF subfamily)
MSYCVPLKAPAHVNARAPEAERAARDPQEPQEATIRAAQSGSLEAFEQIVGLFEARILAYLRQLTRNTHDAEDVAQETFVKAYRSLGQFDPSRPMAGWLFTIARRTAISHFRSHRPPAFEASESLADRPDFRNPSEDLAAKDDGAALWLLAERLKPRQREALWLHYAEDLPVAECARVMGLTQVHVKVLLHRGRQGLASLLQLGIQQAPEVLP